jgi:hypothetical protein
VYHSRDERPDRIFVANLKGRDNMEAEASKRTLKKLTIRVRNVLTGQRDASH